jgi:GT2 family glycosyltransferase
MPGLPKISVVILSHNKIDYTRTCIHSLLATDYPDWEIVIIDNGSTDGTAEWLKNFQKEAETGNAHVQLIFNPGNIGCSTARNQGIEAASGELIAFCDNDIALRNRNWLRIMAEDLRSPDVGMVGPKIIYPFAPYNIQCAGAAVTQSGRIQFIGRGENRDEPLYNARKEVQCLISACCMTKKSVLDKVGGFDEVFNPVEYEDIDLCYRIRWHGFKILYNPAAEMYHFESVTTEGTESLPNTYLIVKHSLIFKERWKHMFEKEQGPPEEAARWRRIPPKRLADIGELEVL